MTRWVLVVLVCLCLVPEVALSQTAAPAAPSGATAVDPKALEILKQMSDRLASARRLSFRAQAVYDVPGKDAVPVFYATVSDVYFARPNTLRVITVADGPFSELLYDGKQVAVFSPAENTLASGPAPDTIEAAIRMVEEGGVDLPFADVLLNDFLQKLQLRPDLGLHHRAIERRRQDADRCRVDHLDGSPCPAVDRHAGPAATPDLGHLYRRPRQAAPYRRIFTLANQRAATAGLPAAVPHGAGQPDPVSPRQIALRRTMMRKPMPLLTLSAGLLTLLLMTDTGDAFWYARGWRGGVAVGGFRPPAVVQPYYLGGCLRCAPYYHPGIAAALAARAAAAGAAAGAAATAPPPAAAAAPATAPAAPPPASSSTNDDGDDASNSGASQTATAPQATTAPSAAPSTDAAASCAAGLSGDPRAIYDKTAPHVSSLASLKEVVTTATRQLVMSGKIPQATAKASAQAAGKCLELLAGN